MNRFKATMLCTFSLECKGFAFLIIAEVFTAYKMLFSYIDKYNLTDIVLCSDVFIAAILFLFGISFYQRHDALCTSNAVSMKYRVISLSIAVGVGCTIAAAMTAAVYSLPEIQQDYSFSVLFRTVAAGGAAVVSPIGSFAENLFFYVSIVSVGCFIGSLRSKKGSGFTLLMLMLAAAALFGIALLNRKFSTPLLWLGSLPALMLRSRISAIILNIIIAAASLYFAVILTYGMDRKTRRKKHEA